MSYLHALDSACELVRQSFVIQYRCCESVELGDKRSLVSLIVIWYNSFGNAALVCDVDKIVSRMLIDQEYSRNAYNFYPVVEAVWHDVRAVIV